MSEQIISTKDEVGSYDAIASAKPGEPLFPLQGGDPLAPFCVMMWARAARRKALRMAEDDKARAKLLRKASDAEEVAWAMKDYQRAEAAGAQIVEQAPPPPVSYSGIAVEKPGEWMAGIVAGVRHLSDAAAALDDAAAHLPPDQAAALAEAIEQVKAIAARYKPQRASYPKTPEFPTA